MKTITYHEDSEAIADHKAEERARQFLLSEEMEISVSSDCFITAIRCLVCEGIYPHDKVLIKYEDSFIHLDKDGRIDFWPVGFCDVVEKLLCRLLVSNKKSNGTNLS